MQLSGLIRTLRTGLLLASMPAILGSPRAGHCAGLTLITHGFNGNAQGWVLGMASHIPEQYRFPGTNVICYEVSVTDNGGLSASWRKLAGGNPATDSNTEIVIKLDWGDLAGFFNQYDTYETAAAVVPHLLRNDFISELNNHALAEFPIHLIGHSRGGSLVCELSRLLGQNGVWVDQVTTLDPHPVNQDGNVDPLTVSDAPLRIYENVLFADNYYQDFDGYPHGQFMASSYNRQLTALPGGYSSAHSDTHLWYHATVQLLEEADDTEALLTAGNRAAWFTTYEDGGTRAGFFYSRLGGGNRLSIEQPAGIGTDRPAYGYNQQWDLGAGISPNRTALPALTDGWPSLIKCNIAGTNLMQLGASNAVSLRYQWARPATSAATVNVYLDNDQNPWNGNDILVGQTIVSGTTSAQVGSGVIGINVAATNTVPGLHYVYARISDGNRTRYLYTPESLTVVSSFEPPRLAVSSGASSEIRIDVHGIPGQRVVLQTTVDFQTWRSIATNWLAADQWSYIDDTGGEAAFYRAALP